MPRPGGGVDSVRAVPNKVRVKRTLEVGGLEKMERLIQPSLRENEDNQMRVPEKCGNKHDDSCYHNKARVATLPGGAPIEGTGRLNEQDGAKGKMKVFKGKPGADLGSSSSLRRRTEIPRGKSARNLELGKKSRAELQRNLGPVQKLSERNSETPLSPSSCS